MKRKVKSDDVFYSTYITLKNGKRIYASSYGKKAFRFEKHSKKRK